MPSRHASAASPAGFDGVRAEIADALDIHWPKAWLMVVTKNAVLGAMPLVQAN